MFEAKFENEHGILRLSGGNGSVFRTIKIEGLGLPQRDYTVMHYGGQPGQVLISEKDLARVITLSGDVALAIGLSRELSRMMKILRHKGTLTVASENRVRAIDCRCTAINEAERHGRETATLVLQFTCDHPYFTDLKPRQYNLFYRKDLVSSAFKLPRCFTERVCRLDILNDGDMHVEPIITVYKDGQGTINGLQAEPACLEIINHTTAQHILLERELVPLEVVKLDIPKRQILSSVAGDITAQISQNSFLSDFVLTPGVNDVEVINQNPQGNICVVLQYQNQYIEAVI